MNGNMKMKQKTIMFYKKSKRLILNEATKY